MAPTNANNRESFGIPGLDRVTGGFEAASCLALIGPPASGKSWFAFQFLRAGLRERGGRAVYIALRPAAAPRRQRKPAALSLVESYIGSDSLRVHDVALNAAIKRWCLALLDELGDARDVRFVIELEPAAGELAQEELLRLHALHDYVQRAQASLLLTTRATLSTVELLNKASELSPNADGILTLHLRSSEWGLERHLLIATLSGSTVPQRYYPLELGSDGLRLESERETSEPASQNEPLRIYISAPPYLQGKDRELYARRARRHLSTDPENPGIRPFRATPLFSRVLSEVYAPATDLGLGLVSDPGVVQRLAAQDLLLAVDAVFPDFRELFSNTAVRRSELGGKAFALPQHVSLRMLYFRKDLLDKYGFMPPRTWDELELQARAIVRREKEPSLSPFLFEFRPGIRFNLLTDLLWSAGLEPFVRNGAFALNRKAVGDALLRLGRWMREFAPVERLSVEAEYWDAFSAFFAGRAVFLYHWSDGIRLIEGRRARAKFGWCAVPSADGRTPGTARVGGVSWVVPKNTRNPAAALRMLRRLIEPSFAKRMEIDFGWPFPALRSLYDDERVLRARPYYAEADALLERGKLPEEAEYLYGGPQPWETTGGDAVTEALSSLGQGHDLEEVLTRLEALLNPLLPTPSFGGLAGRAAALIGQNLRDRLTGAAIAQKLGVTRAHLSRVFHENTGQTLHDFVEAARIAKAKELLRYTNRRIGEVALELGFKSIHHFSRVFSARVGASPRAFRNSV